MGSAQQAMIASVAQPATGCSGTLCTDLVASWKLDDLVDATGTVTNLTNNNSVTFVAGKIGNAAQFVRASSKSLSHATNATLEMGDIDFTIAAWVYMDSAPGDMRIVTKEDDVAGRDYNLWYNSGSTALTFTVYEVGNAPVSVNWSAPVTTATWYCIVAWHDATANTISISLDGAAADSNITGAALQTPTAAPFRIGSRAYSGFEDYFDGRIDNVNIAKRVWSAGEITAFYNSGTGVEHPYSVL